MNDTSSTHQDEVLAEEQKTHTRKGGCHFCSEAMLQANEYLFVVVSKQHFVDRGSLDRTRGQSVAR